MKIVKSSVLSISNSTYLKLPSSSVSLILYLPSLDKTCPFLYGINELKSKLYSAVSPATVSQVAETSLAVFPPSVTPIKKYIPSALILLVVISFAYYIGLLGQYDYAPSVWKVITETFVYNVSVGFLEELYIRALLLNVIIWLCAKKKNATFIAIIISSALFSVGHLPGMIGLDIFTISLRLIWTLMLGIYLGVMYKKTGNLWVPIIAHTLINFSGIAFCFTTQRDFPKISVVIIMIATVIAGVWSIYRYFKQDNQTAKQVHNGKNTAHTQSNI